MNFFTGAAAGVAANEAQRHIDKHLHQERDNESWFRKLCDLHNDIRTIANFYKSLEEAPVDIVVTLLPDPQRIRLSTLGRKYNLIFVPNNSTQITANIPGLGPLTFTPTVGWTELDFREGTELYLATGTTQNIILRCSNVSLGANVL